MKVLYLLTMLLVVGVVVSNADDQGHDYVCPDPVCYDCDLEQGCVQCPDQIKRYCYPYDECTSFCRSG
ncbi:hypothetical protein HOLleu_00062 [Holothuria leucospilota]|uniref:Uncharacterized protein n=1 Tax=Holothuria leucospilota TaxID=206669 RepID=A0A9Q1HJE9_HOLLE|nr:hypothetical protein HOLleu_00062 [Holothuria leucospilota]